MPRQFPLKSWAWPLLPCPALSLTWTRLPRRNSLTPDVRGTLQQHLARSDGHDPYRHVVLKVLGRLDLTRKSVPDVIKTSDDYLWLQLHLVRDGTSAPEPRASEADYTLSELQATLNRFGSAHFNASARGVASNPLKFFIVLVLSLQYEQVRVGLRRRLKRAGEAG